jgi:hypothetical protein
MTDERSHDFLHDAVNQVDRDHAAHGNEDGKPPNVRILPDGTVLPDYSDFEPTADTVVDDVDKVAPGTVVPDPDAERR